MATPAAVEDRRKDDAVGRRLLIVDDQDLIRRFCRIALEHLGCTCEEACDGPSALALFQQRRFDLVLLDIELAEMSGWEVCRQLRHLPGRPHLKVLLFSGNANPDDLAKMLLAGADDYMTKPFSPVQLVSRVQAALQLQQAQDQMDRLNRDLLAVNREMEKHLQDRAGDLVEARNALFLALAKLAESRDTDTGAHLLRLQTTSKCLGDEALRSAAFPQQLDENFVAMLACCAPLHDIGKVSLPDDILRKPGPLTADERRRMETHTVIGAQTFREVARRHSFALAFLEMSIDIARHHHERYDGAGYPDRLRADAIPLSARIITICDVYDALRSQRVYKPVVPHDEVVHYIRAGAGTQFDPALVECFLRCADDFERIFNETMD